jgi:hypothetical protein
METLLHLSCRCRKCASQKIVKRTRLRRASKVRRTQLTKYSELRLAYLREHLFCEVGNCKNMSTQVHHLAGRQGKRLLDFNNCLAVCFDCHRQIHDHPRWAREQGYLI